MHRLSERAATLAVSVTHGQTLSLEAVKRRTKHGTGLPKALPVHVT